MKILMLGNSFTFYNNLPDKLAKLTGAEVVHHTRGGAYLAEHLNLDTKLGALTQAAMKEYRWDYVILQEMSNAPIISKNRFLQSVAALCKQIQRNGAIPVLFATWAYKRGSKNLASMNMSYEEMAEKISDAYHEAAEQNHALIADVGQRFFEMIETQELYAEDSVHPSEDGSCIAAEVLASVIWESQKAISEGEMGAENKADEADSRLRLLYLYQILLRYSDEDHMLTTKQIISLMWERHHIYMHRTTVPKDIELLRVAGIEVMSERRQAWNYYLSDRIFSVPELKVLIDAVQSSRFITEKKSRSLIEKLTSLTSEMSASRLSRSVHVTERAKSENEKGYYIVDAINEAIHNEKKIRFRYFNFDKYKNSLLKNNGAAYTVSPYDLIWDGDFYYLTGYCDERCEMRTFRVDRIYERPLQLNENAVEPPDAYSVSSYTQEVFRMYSSRKPQEVILLCEAPAMNAVIDKFGIQVHTEPVEGKDQFYAKVKVCPGPTFYRWIFGWEGRILIAEPEELKKEYREMLKRADSFYLTE